MKTRSLALISLGGFILTGCGALSSGDTPTETHQAATTTTPATSTSESGQIGNNSRIPASAKKAMHLGGGGPPPPGK